MDFGCNLGCIGVTTTAIAILLEKRFLTSLSCGVMVDIRAWRVASVASE